MTDRERELITAALRGYEGSLEAAYAQLPSGSDGRRTLRAVMTEAHQLRLDIETGN